MTDPQQPGGDAEPPDAPRRYPPGPGPYPGAPAWGYPPPYGLPYAPPPYAAPPRSSGLAVAALVLGILALLLFWFPVVGTVLAVLAVIFGVRAWLRRAQARGVALAGLICGAVATVLSVLVLVLVVKS